MKKYFTKIFSVSFHRIVCCLCKSELPQRGNSDLHIQHIDQVQKGLNYLRNYGTILLSDNIYAHSFWQEVQRLTS